MTTNYIEEGRKSMKTPRKSMLYPNCLPVVEGRQSYKTIQDLVLYSYIIAAEKPSTIVEFGSATGASAIYLRQFSSYTEKPARIISYDIIDTKPHEGIEFIKQDLSSEEGFDWGQGSKLVIEDSHVPGVLLKADKYLTKGDILVVEDLDLYKGKRDLFEDFLLESTNDYEDANEYLSMFGEQRDSTCDAVLRVL